jgi:hypothetical protein
MPQRLETREEVESLFQWAQAGGMETLDLVELWQGRDLTNLRVAPWDRHPNAEGHRIMADAIYELFLTSGILEADTRPDDQRVSASFGQTFNKTGGPPDPEGM